MTVHDATEKLRKHGHEVRFLPGPDGDRYAINDYHYTGPEVIFLVQNGLKPGVQLWSRVALHRMPETEATGLMNAVLEAYQARGMPEGVEVFRAPASGGIVYYFSPQAAGLIPKSFERTPCVKPDVAQMRKAQL